MPDSRPLRSIRSSCRVALLGLSAVMACEGPLPAENPKTELDQPVDVMPILVSPGASEATHAAKHPHSRTPAVAFRDVGLDTPESVLHDPASDRYLVSNIAGSPDAKDNRGFISRLHPDGTVEELHWITSGKHQVTLHAPKGMALQGGTLWVTDIDQIRGFDATTGEPTHNIEIPGATFLNDLAVAEDGSLFVTDSGLQSAEGGLKPSGTDAIYRVEAGTPSAIVKSEELHGPNGIAVQGQRLLIVNFGNRSLRAVDLRGREIERAELPSGSLDGVVVLGDDDFLISSWDASTVYQGGFSDGFRAVVSDVRSPADIGHDTKRQRLLVPLFLEHQLLAFDLERGESTSASAPESARPTESAHPKSVGTESPAPAVSSH